MLKRVEGENGAALEPGNLYVLIVHLTKYNLEINNDAEYSHKNNSMPLIKKSKTQQPFS